MKTRTRTLAAAGAGVLVAGLAVGLSTTAHADARQPTNAEARDRADAAVATHRGDIRGADGDQYSLFSVATDASGASHARYNRSYKGLYVRGGDFVVNSAPGGAYAGAITAQLAPLSLDIRPAVPAEAATATAKAHFQGKAESTQAPRLMIDATGATAHLTWETVVRGWAPDGQTPSVLHVYSDAKTGDYIGANDEIDTVTGTGNSIYSGSVSIETTGSGGSFSMVDPTHGNNRTCDMNNGTSTCTTFTDADNVWGNGANSNRQSAGVDAHYGAAKTFDYYKNVHGRNGIFNNGTGVPSRVHYSSGYVNAFWDGAQMTYGDGSGNAKPLVALDVAGHEMSHGVTENSVPGGLTYSGESGGLNEATSDIFGTFVEFFANNASDPGDYDIGEKIDIFGNGRPLRFMYNPTLDGNSHGCWSTTTKNIDVHYSSGPANHFVFDLAEGTGSTPFGTSPVCGGAPAVTGIGRAKTEKIWYRALTTYFTSNTSYVNTANPTNTARAATLKAATDLYGLCGTEYKAVQAAWTAVNVAGNDAPCGGTPTSTPSTPPPGGCGPFTNGTDVAIPDAGAAVFSNIAVTGCNRNASATTKVEVHIKHTYRGDLVIDLVAPDGTAYRLKNSSGSDSADNVDATFTVNASSEAGNGTWRLKVQDVFSIDTGNIDSWTLTL